MPSHASQEDILPPELPAFGGVIGNTLAESRADWPVQVQPPAGAPNIVIVMLDDLGFGHSGCYGGQIRTPHIDRLAEQGLRYNNFHTTGLCSPSRAALLTGRNHHSVGFAAVSEMSTGFPGGHGFLPKSAATLAEVLKQHGYNTMAVGKWHLAPGQHTSAAGPFDRWPLGMGFERFYGFLPGETDHWHPMLTVDNHRIPAPAQGRDGRPYHFSEDIIDQAIGMLRDQQQVASGKPFLLYAAFGAPHCPFHVAPEWIEKYKGRFDAGWDAARQEIFSRQQALGIVPADAVLPEPNPGIKAWAEHTPDEQRLFARLMETFAGFVEHTDAQIGRLMRELERLRIEHNTLVLFLSDNGASQEGGSMGTLNTETFRNLIQMSVPDMLKQFDEIGSHATDPHYPKGWGMAGNTPFKRWKRDTHRGGNSDPLIVRWPARIADAGAIRPHYHHLTDLYPTLLEIIGVPAPRRVHGVQQMPLAGVSMAATLFDAQAPRLKRVQHYEMLGSRAVWADGWSAATWHQSGTDWQAERWELYHTDEDFSQARDLSAVHPDKLEELKALWWEQARRHQVLPLDDRGRERMIDPTRPGVFQVRERYRYFAHTSPVPSNCRPALINRSHTLTARVVVDARGGHGVLCAVGSAISGWALFIKDGQAQYSHNALKLAYSVLRAPQRLGAGAHEIVLEFEAIGRGQGRARLLVDGAQAVGWTQVQTPPLMTSPMHEGLVIGRFWGSSPAYLDCDGPFEFNGEIEEIEIAPGPMLQLPAISGRAEG